MYGCGFVECMNLQCYDVVQLLSNSNVAGVVFANWTRDLIIITSHWYYGFDELSFIFFAWMLHVYFASLILLPTCIEVLFSLNVNGRVHAS